MVIGRASPRPLRRKRLPFTIGQILDLLMIVVLIMFIPIGLWRGVLREWLALIGIALGLLLANEWAGPWGGDLAAQTGLKPEMGAFIVGAAFFLGTTLLIGYGGGAALPYRPDLTWANRLLGALIGLGNGVLILSGMLRLMQRHLFGDQPDSLLLGTVLSRFLIDYVGWAQLVLLLTLALCVIISVFRRWVGGPPLMEEFAPGYLAAYPTPNEVLEEIWHAEPPADAPEETAPPEAPATPAVAARAQHETAVLHFVPPQAAPRPPASPAIVPSATPPPRATTLVSVPRVVDIARPARAVPTPPPEPASPGEVTAPGYANGHTPAMAEPAPPTPIARNSPPTAVPNEPLTCPVCDNTVAARSRFCHHCGHIIGEAERRRVARQD